jgi:hypothetical protein
LPQDGLDLRRPACSGGPPAREVLAVAPDLAHDRTSPCRRRCRRGVHGVGQLIRLLDPPQATQASMLRRIGPSLLHDLLVQVPSTREGARPRCSAGAGRGTPDPLLLRPYWSRPLTRIPSAVRSRMLAERRQPSRRQSGSRIRGSLVRISGLPSLVHGELRHVALEEQLHRPVEDDA